MTDKRMEDEYFFRLWAEDLKKVALRKAKLAANVFWSISCMIFLRNIRILRLTQVLTFIVRTTTS